MPKGCPYCGKNVLPLGKFPLLQTAKYFKINQPSGHTEFTMDLFQDRMCLIWVDAHGDIETPEVSPSKNMHGMPVSFHVKEMFQNDHYPEHIEQLKWFKPW